MFELDAQGDFAAGELVGQHRHCAPEHVWPDVAGGDFLSPVRVLVVLMWAMKVSSIWWLRATTACCRQRREQPVSGAGQLLGDDHGFSDRGSDPPVFDGRLGSCLPLVDLMAGVPK